MNVSDTFGQNFFKYKAQANHSIMIGAGPSFIYADNGGRFTDFNFRFNPAFTAAYSKSFNENLDIRINFGHQRIGVREATNQERIDTWNSNNAAIGFTGYANFLDIMPTYKLIGTAYPLIRPEFNFHVGTGVGVLQSRTNLQYGDGQPNRNQTLMSLYVPVRAGLTYQLNPKTDLILEGSILLTLTDEIDGNIGYNRFNDHLFQFQIMVKRYLNLKSELY